VHYTKGEVLVHSDSELVIKQITGSYKVKKPHLQELLDRVKMKEKAFAKVSYANVPREHPKLRLVDRLANEALDGC